MNNKKNEKSVINLKIFNFKTKKDIKLSLNKDSSNRHSSSQQNNKIYQTKKSLQIKINNIKLYNNNLICSKLKRNKTTDYFYYNSKNDIKKPILCSKDKLKIKSIIKIFKKNKLATKGLFNKEKQLPLNSINSSNFSFLFNEEQNYNNKRIHLKKQKIKKSKSNLLLLSSSMINKFNNKTSSILDVHFQNNKFNKNIFNFRRQIIGSYINQDRNIQSLEYSKQRYMNALDILDQTEDEKLYQNLKIEEQFYKLKRKEIGLFEFETLQEKTNKENIERFNSFKNLKSSNIYFGKRKDKNNIAKIKNKILSSKSMGSNNIFNSSKKVLNQKINKTKLLVNDSKAIKNKTNNENIKILDYSNRGNEKHLTINKNYSDRKKYNNENSKKRKHLTNMTCNNYINSKNRINNPNNNDKEKEMGNIMKNFWRFQQKKIKEKSKRLANSISQMNYFHYMPKGYVDYKNSTLNINTKNLTRVIKLMKINKYLCDIEDDDLLVFDTQKLKNLIQKAEIQYYLSDKKAFQLSYLRKNLRPQTISKFCKIKSSFFGLPC